MTEAATLRRDLTRFLELDLVGPAAGQDEELDDSPRIRYLAGILFPQEMERNESEAAGGVEDTTDDHRAAEQVAEVVESEDQGAPTEARKADGYESDYDDTLTLANSYRPSAIGLSFFVAAGAMGFDVQPRAAVYESRTGVSGQNFPITKWKRKAVEIPAIKVALKSDSRHWQETWNLAPGLSLRGVFRRRDNSQTLVTVSLFNSAQASQKSAPTFYQCGLTVTAHELAPLFVEYASETAQFRDSEEAVLGLLYRNRRTFAVGHGCAAVWRSSAESGAFEISTSPIPQVVVPPVNAVSQDANFLSMEFLGDPENAQNIPAALHLLCDDYQHWISTKEDESAALKNFEGETKRCLARCKVALARMRAGVEFLRADRRASESFVLMNRAMLMQQLHSKRRRSLGDPWEPLAADKSAYRSDWARRSGFWRTFQVAFILMNLRGVSGREDTINLEGDEIPERDLVDLIWFPTGGGKTEAYLGLSAYLMLHRRLTDPSDSGCKIIMRYTLRLLTSQQFQRAASLVCACEIIRRENPGRFGSTPISIGLYVGLSLTPNTEADALRAVARLNRKGQGEKNPFQLLHCPWCGTELDNEECLGYVDRKKRMAFLCPSRTGLTDPVTACPFSERANHLPICVVDESIYVHPPTLLIATVDKFAMLSWRSEAGRILTEGGGPQLIIQDELHLISGPLGSMVGLYEGVFEYLCSMSGARPKIIASTATIRRADEQCRALYDRRMFQFPPSGIDASDSFFAKEDRSAPGRLYVGFLPTAASSPLTAQIRTIVAMQQGLLLVADKTTSDESIDPYWTLVQYFGSLKELGHAATFVTADIPEFLPTMHRRYSVESDRKRWMTNSDELTSRKNESEIPQTLKRLEVRYRSNAARYEQALDTLLATNMISVGVDVDRLGLMLVVTQPKGTSEYIQASSRVGRSARGPGLVFTLYNAGRPRDRSHYEHFYGYHQAYYRFVEPTSVTPFSPPAMQRALHAVLVIAGRHIARWMEPADIDTDDPEFQKFVTFLRERVRRIDPDHLEDFEEVLRSRLDDWRSRSPDRWGDFSDSSEGRPLMRPGGRPARENETDSWETPTSMRTVDVECAASVLSRYPEDTVEASNG